jgi:hypothetical protein
MKRYFDYIKKDRLIFRLFISAFFFLGLTLVFTLLNYSKLPPLLPVFNQLPWGADRLSSTLGIFIPSILVLMISFINLLLCGYIYSNSPLLSRIFAFTTFLISLLNFLFIIRTVLLIT